MELSARSLAKGAANWVISPLGVEVVRKDRHDWSDTRNFIPLEDTLAGARSAGLSVGDYIDTVLNNIPGGTQFTIDEMKRLGVFGGKVDTVLEVGPGSGRYLEKTIALCAPRRYEIYETSEPWAAFLARDYGVVWQPTDGGSFASTPMRPAISFRLTRRSLRSRSCPASRTGTRWRAWREAALTSSSTS
jgi:hypothetical protein